MNDDTMRPSLICTAASMSPWRDVPQPEKVPSFSCTWDVSPDFVVLSAGGVVGAAGSVAAGGATGVAGSVAFTGTGTLTVSVTICGRAFSESAADGLLAAGFAAAIVLGTEEATGAAESTCAFVGASRRGALGASDAAGATRRSGGLRSADSSAKRSAADRVRAYPAEYTASTAAEPRATRLLLTHRLGPLVLPL